MLRKVVVLLIPCLVFFSAQIAFSDVIVSAGDYVGSNYVFELDTTSRTTYSNSHNSALNASSNVGLSPSWQLPFMLYYFSGVEAEITYRWDFSSAPKPKQVTIRDRLTLFSNTTVNRANATISYSLDGTNYITARTFSTPNDGSLVGDSRETYTLGLGSGVNEFYYRVNMMVASGDSNGTMDSFQDQWARTTAGAEDSPFSATFSTVPEPGSLGVTGFVFLMTLRRKRTFGKSV